MSEYECREYIVLYECDGDSMFDMGTRERIVRCMDCRWAKPDHSDHEYRCNMWVADVDAYGFCFRAMRKEDSE